MADDISQTTRYQAAVIAACKAGDTHLTCSFPHCGCKTLPKQIRAGLEEFCCGDAKDDLLTDLRSYGSRQPLMSQAADEIERLRIRERCLLDIIRHYNPDDALFDHEKVAIDV